MKANIDIDRISLEDRVSALEGRIPIGGSSSASGAWMLNPKVIDSCRDNEITELNDGFVAKFEIPNLGALQSQNPTNYPVYFNNLEMKISMFFPLLNGSLMSCSQVLVRVRATATLTNLPPPNSSPTRLYLVCPIQDWSKIISRFGFGATMWTLSVLSPMSYPGGIVLGTPAQLFSSDTSMTLSVNSGPNPTAYMNLSMKGGRYSSPNYTFPAVGPSVAFGMAMLPPLTSIGNHSVYSAAFNVGSYPARPFAAGFTGAQPSDLPAYLKPSYPDSWYA